MFRPMQRIKKQMPAEECKLLLKQEVRGVLSVLGDDDYPYGVTLNYWYSEEDNRIYFHGGKTGHRVDAVKKHDKVSFCVYDQGYREEGDWALNIRSVIVFGRLKPVKDYEKAMHASRQLSYQFTQDTAFIEGEISKEGPHTLCYELVIEHMTGKAVKEA